MPQPLALELYRTIVGSVKDTTDLLSLSLCCSTLRHEAQRSLFHHPEPKSLHRQQKLISGINAAPLRLGPLVKTLCIRYKPELDEGDFFASLSLALSTMKNLHHLSNDGVHIPSTILRDCTFKLCTLVWNCDMNKQDVLFFLCDFLPTQYSIELLQLGPAEESDMKNVPTNLCPKLKYLGASNDTITTALLRDNRLITRFQWHQQGCLPKMTSRQVNHLKYLLLCGIQDLNKDTVFASRLASLAILELRSRHSELMGLHRLVPILCNLPCLQILVLHILDTFHGLVMHVTSAYREAFELCPTLTYIDVRVEGGLFYDRYLRPTNGDNGRWNHSRILIEWDASEWGQHSTVGLS